MVYNKCPESHHRAHFTTRYRIGMIFIECEQKNGTHRVLKLSNICQQTDQSNFERCRQSLQKHLFVEANGLSHIESENEMTSRSLDYF